MLIFSKPSLSMRAATFVTSLLPSNFTDKKADRLWTNVMHRSKPKHAAPPCWLRLKLQITQHQVGDQAVFEISDQSQASGYHILYLHGSGYVNPLHPAHWQIVNALIRHTGAGVTMPTYPLAPEHGYHDALTHLEAVYRQTLAKYPDKKIALCGDSAGGGLALALTLICQQKSLPMPTQLVLFSPWLDITLADPEAASVEANDVMLGVAGLRRAGMIWACGEDPRNPLLSPLYANISALPPTTIFQGTSDIFICDARTFSRKALKEKKSVQLYEYAGAFHVYMAATFTPEAQDTFRRIGELMR